jgi:hypothetical protein
VRQESDISQAEACSYLFLSELDVSMKIAVSLEEKGAKLD